MNSDEHRPGDRELGALQEVADTARQELAEHMAITEAEGTVASVRMAQLDEHSRKASWRISAMRSQLLRAQQNGDAEEIAAARQRLERAGADFDRISKACIAEGQQIVGAGLERLGATFGLMDESRVADGEVVEAQGRPKYPL